VLEEQKDNANAAQQYEIALRYGLDRDPEAYTRLAKLYRLMGRSRDAVRLVQRGLRIFPTNSELYRLYGEVGGLSTDPPSETLK
jgi:tetratricopeptide (TPR) repeat protein